MTTDSGANIVAAFRIVEILRISCFGHNLDLAINKGLPSTTCIVKVSFFSGDVSP